MRAGTPGRKKQVPLPIGSQNGLTLSRGPRVTSRPCAQTPQQHQPGQSPGPGPDWLTRSLEAGPTRGVCQPKEHTAQRGLGTSLRTHSQQSGSTRRARGLASRPASRNLVAFIHQDGVWQKNLRTREPGLPHSFTAAARKKMSPSHAHPAWEPPGAQGGWTPRLGLWRSRHRASASSAGTRSRAARPEWSRGLGTSSQQAGTQ